MSIQGGTAELCQEGLGLRGYGGEMDQGFREEGGYGYPGVI
jgi:hypothetical protein